MYGFAAFDQIINQPPINIITRAKTKR